MTGFGIERYRDFLGARYQTFLHAFSEFRRIGGRTIVELGTTRSYVSEGHPGCLSSDPRYWHPDRPETWDLREARVVIAHQLLSPRGVILVDDVNVPGSAGSKGRLSIPYLCQHGFEVKLSGYQVVLQRPEGSCAGSG